ncbi:helix-turn-helix domain-containing protein [Paenibacillus beijingensis]|uniref:HTH araC/xylS-type domain-containing protein n=1 Tax=Paenibacillus beijingensis TaxID=1126833 RepID=A0A0D5NPJ1_9BACL|nr:helix-turn-helix domain-containing protein [Paenibacillus beijingensis]AJY76838.1 hypothetical protein VN24_22605 [Paenibacillus beijingensis]
MHQLWPKQSFLRIFLLIAISFMLLVTPFSLYLSYLFSDHAYQEIDRFNEQMLMHTQRNIEFLADQLKNYSLNIYQDAHIQKWFQASEDENKGMLQNDALIALTKYMTNEPFIRSAYLVNTRTSSVIDYRSRKYTFKEFHDAAILRIIRERSDRFLQYIPHEVDGQTYQALIVPSSRQGVQYNGYLVLLLDRVSLEEYLLQNSEIEGIETFVVGADGGIVLGNVRPELADKLKRMPAGELGRYETSVDGQKWSVNHAKVPLEDWTVYYLTRMSNLTKETGKVQRTLLWCSALMFLLLLVILFWNARFTHRKFQLLENRMSELRQFVHSHKEIIRMEAVRQWLLQGKLKSINKQELAAGTSLLTHDRYYVAVLRIDHYGKFCENYSFDSRNLLKFAIVNIATEVVGRGGRSAVGVDFGSDHLAFVIGSNERAANELVPSVQEAANQVLYYLKIETIASISGTLDINDDFHQAYKQVLELTLLKFLTGERKVYEEKDLGAYSALVHSSDKDALLNQFLEAIRFGRKEQAEKRISELVRHLQGLAYEDCRFQLNLLFYRLYRSFGHLTSLDLDSKAGIQGFIDRFGDLSELEDWLVRESDSIIRQLSQSMNRSSGVKEEHVKEIVTYIHTHLHDPNLSVNDIADHVSLSVGYLRQLFKDHLQVTVADYILMSRINYVKELMETTGSSITEIAEMAGFLTKSHFFTVFKKVTGVTPNEYRKYVKVRQPDSNGGNG